MLELKNKVLVRSIGKQLTGTHLILVRQKKKTKHNPRGVSSHWKLKELTEAFLERQTTRLRASAVSQKLKDTYCSFPRKTKHRGSKATCRAQKKQTVALAFPMHKQ